MALYSALLPVMEANQWFKNGDHPEDRTIHGLNTGRIVQRHPTFKPHISHNRACGVCDEAMGLHGVVNPELYIGETEENVLCPGDYVVTRRNKKGRVIGYSVYKQQLFEFFYGPYKEPIE